MQTNHISTVLPGEIDGWIETTLHFKFLKELKCYCLYYPDAWIFCGLLGLINIGSNNHNPVTVYTASNQ